MLQLDHTYFLKLSAATICQPKLKLEVSALWTAAESIAVH